MRLTVVCDKKIESSKSLRTVLIEKSEKKCQTVASYYSIFTHTVSYQIEEKKRKKERQRQNHGDKNKTHDDKNLLFFYLRNEVKLLMTTRVYCFSIKQTDCVRLHFGKAL